MLYYRVFLYKVVFTLDGSVDAFGRNTLVSDAHSTLQNNNKFSHGLNLLGHKSFCSLMPVGFVFEISSPKTLFFKN